MDELQNPSEFLKELNSKVKSKLESGMSRIAIWKEMSASVDSKFHKFLKREVTYSLTDEQMNSINRVNQFLQFLFTTTIITMFAVSILYYRTAGFTWLSAIFSILYLFIAYSLSKGILLKRGYVYRILSHIGMLIVLMKAIDLAQGNEILFNSIFIGLGLLLAIVGYWTHKKLFPSYKLFGDNSPKDNVDILD